MSTIPNGFPQNNFFQIIPPTPDHTILQPAMRITSSYQAPAPTLDHPAPPNANPRLLATRGPGPTPHLHPAPSFASWRTQRSSSVSSQGSSLSNADEWSAFGGGIEAGDVGASDSDGLGGVLGDLHFGVDQDMPGEELGAGARVGTRRTSGRTASLSIDPNLIRPKAMAGSGGGGSSTAKPTTKGMQKDEMVTAKPKRKGGAAKTSPKAKKVSHARKLNADHIPRPRNAFILFRKHVVDAKLIPPSVEIRHQNVSVIVAKMWADAKPEQKEEFSELAKIEKEEHLKKYPGYRYQPVYRRTNVIRRRVRKDSAEDEKCTNVAALLLQGTSGSKLEEHIKGKVNQSGAQKGTKARKVNPANELSKGALRALRAQARQQPSDTSEGNSRSQSVCFETDSNAYNYHSRRSSIASDLEPNFESKYTVEEQFNFHPTQLAQDGYQFGTAPAQGLGGGMLPAYGIDGGMRGWGPDLQNQVRQQTWSYPDQQQHNVMPMNDFSYQQPTQMDSFFNYDQALPFSPTAHRFDQPFAFPAQPANPSMMHHNQHQYYPVGGVGPSTTYGLSGEDYTDLQPQQNSFSQQDIGGMTLPSYAPQSARWDANFQPGIEGLPFDETLLGDFGAALIQAEENGVW